MKLIFFSVRTFIFSHENEQIGCNIVAYRQTKLNLFVFVLAFRRKWQFGFFLLFFHLSFIVDHHFLLLFVLEYACVVFSLLL